jgi:hypothetical protein
MRLPLLSGAAIAALLLALVPVALAADAPAMSPTTGPPTGGTVVEVTGGSGYTDSTTVTMCGVTVAGHASTGGTTLTFATPALPNPYVCSQGLVSVTTNNPSTAGLPAFTYVSTVVPGPEGLTGTVWNADGSPKAGADLWLIQTYPTIVDRTTTDAEGHYRLTAPAGFYYLAYVQTQDPLDPPTADWRAVYHSVGFWGMSVAAGGTTQLDWVLPEMSMKGNCNQTSCKVHVSISGFGALVPVKIYLQSVDVPGFQLALGTLTANAAGAAKGAFTFAKPETGGSYYTAAGPSQAVTYGKVTYSREILRVP